MSSFVRKLLEKNEWKYLQNNRGNIQLCLLKIKNEVKCALYNMKRISENQKNIQIVVRLNTNEREKERKNSILTLWKIKDKVYKQFIRNRKIIWSNIDKNDIIKVQ